ncbi:beta-glucosidase 13-like [Quercus lobata]|uniref:beta-glucosidase 13-like n=1 Tax=Quercus lobata TaxID=97700 RepID=UPI0012491871|nr:beta-glucosidase 13-like [Quercus lobata]
MAFNLALPMRPSMAGLGSLKKSETTIFGASRRVPSLRNENKSLRLTIRCWKGSVPPTSVTDKTNSTDQTEDTTAANQITRKDFATDFKFGCSTSALQTEGKGDEGGRGPSTWDRNIQDSTGITEVAVDSYHRYKDDVQVLVDMGADTYRFSISWSRILPDGTVDGGINQEGINFYNNLINELIKNGITPFVTLFHFDLPQALGDKYNGFWSSQIVDDFKAYANVCFQYFGDRVKHWITINEPQIWAPYGYKIDATNALQNAATDPFLCAHHIILAHATAVQLYRDTYQSVQAGQIGISLVTEWFLPASDTIQDQDAAQRAFDFLVGWFLEPLVFGDYPFIMKALVRDGLPEFTDDEKTLIKGSFEFIGVNYYTSRYATAVAFDKDATFSIYSDYQFATVSVKNKVGDDIGPPTPGSSEIYIYPKGLTDALVYMLNAYNKPKFFVTENGYPEKRDDTIAVKTALQDDARIQHILQHLYAILEAIKEGADVNGYFMWALMDCMEVGSSYQVRFGLAYTDYPNNLERILKKSAKWFKDVFLAS